MREIAFYAALLLPANDLRGPDPSAQSFRGAGSHGREERDPIARMDWPRGC